MLNLETLDGMNNGWGWIGGWTGEMGEKFGDRTLRGNFSTIKACVRVCMGGKVWVWVWMLCNAHVFETGKGSQGIW